MTHLGTENSALPVDYGYRPATMLRALPKPGGGVIAVASARAAPRQSRRLSFSVDMNGESAIPQGNRGGARNLYGPDNAWTDAHGALHCISV